MLCRTLAFALICLAGAAAHAEEGWGLSSWNPFAKKSTSVRPASEQKGLMSRFSMPTFQRKKNEPTTFQRINQGAKSLLTKTKDVLTPWDNEPTRKNSKTSKRWGLFNWGAEPEEKEITTVNDFLKLPAPR